MSEAAVGSGLKVGLYVDVANLTMNGGFGMQYSGLRDFACRGSAEAMRLNAYVSFDPERAKDDRIYGSGQRNFQYALREQGFKVIEKEVKWYTNEDNQRVSKANVDLDLAVDALLQSERMDRVVLATGDGDFVQVVKALQNRGCRVEIVAFNNVSGDLRREADLFMSGFLIPNLLPFEGGGRGAPLWGELGSLVRGVCSAWDQEKGFGYFRFLVTIGSEFWRTDSRQDSSPYRSTFCHVSDLPRDLDPSRLPSRDIILEFAIVETVVKGEKKTKAVDVRWVRKKQ